MELTDKINFLNNTNSSSSVEDFLKKSLASEKEIQGWQKIYKTMDRFSHERDLYNYNFLEYSKVNFPLLFNEFEDSKDDIQDFLGNILKSVNIFYTTSSITTFVGGSKVYFLWYNEHQEIAYKDLGIIFREWQPEFDFS